MAEKERFEQERNTSRVERENSPTPPVADEVGEFEWPPYRKAEPLPDHFIAALSSSCNSASRATPCAIISPSPPNINHNSDTKGLRFF